MDYLEVVQTVQREYISISDPCMYDCENCVIYFLNFNGNFIENVNDIIGNPIITIIQLKYEYVVDISK